MGWVKEHGVSIEGLPAPLGSEDDFDALFGSAARDELRDDSDIDILVAFDGPTTVARYSGLEDRPEALLGRRVDLVTEKGLEPRARPHVERELVDVA